MRLLLTDADPGTRRPLDRWSQRQAVPLGLMMPAREGSRVAERPGG